MSAQQELCDLLFGPKPCPARGAAAALVSCTRGLVCNVKAIKSRCPNDVDVRQMNKMDIFKSRIVQGLRISQEAAAS